ncbi:MAG: hypothetical protein J6B01_04410 [Ruminococcus sp.]|nr:hypothetical protein [Ruminococcus sp.]
MMSGYDARTCSTCGHTEGSGDPHCDKCFMFNAWESREEMNARIETPKKNTFRCTITTANLKAADFIAASLVKQGLIPKDVFIESKTLRKVPDFDRVIFNDPATIIYWSDGTKTVVKCGEQDIFDPEKGLAMAISKKALGNQDNYYKLLREQLSKEDQQ